MTYERLRQAIAKYLGNRNINQTDFDLYVELAMNEINNETNFYRSPKSVVVSSADEIDLPADLKTLQSVVQSDYELSQVSVGDFNTQYDNVASLVFAIEEDKILLHSSLTSADITITYIPEWQTPKEDLQSPEIIKKHYLVLFYAVLKQIYINLRNDTAAANLHGLYQEALDNAILNNAKTNRPTHINRRGFRKKSTSRKYRGGLNIRVRGF